VAGCGGKEITIMTAEADPVPGDAPVTDLVTRARGGDQQAWDAIVERYAPLVWSICRQYRLAEDPPLPYPQISARLGIPAGSIGPTRSRCLAKLRRDPAIAALANAEPARVEK
jgi:hypothetical protein